MIRVALNEAKDELSRYLRMAEAEDVIITRHGVPAGLLIGFSDPEDWWEELLLRNPRFQNRIEQARQSLREGKGITLEELRQKHNIPSGVNTTQPANGQPSEPNTDKVITDKRQVSRKMQTTDKPKTKKLVAKQPA